MEGNAGLLFWKLAVKAYSPLVLSKFNISTIPFIIVKFTTFG